MHTYIHHSCGNTKAHTHVVIRTHIVVCLSAHVRLLPHLLFCCCRISGSRMSSSPCRCSISWVLVCTFASQRKRLKGTLAAASPQHERRPHTPSMAHPALLGSSENANHRIPHPSRMWTPTTEQELSKRMMRLEF